MRGKLEDSLARMARREELQRRRAGASRTGVDELIEAVQRVVARHPGLAVTMSVSQGDTTSVLRVEWTGGNLAVTPAVAPAVEASIEAAPPGADGSAADTQSQMTWPQPGKTVPDWNTAADGSADDPAARLAELIRRDPTLLERARLR